MPGDSTQKPGPGAHSPEKVCLLLIPLLYCIVLQCYTVSCPLAKTPLALMRRVYILTDTKVFDENNRKKTK